MCSLVCYTRALFSDDVDPVAVGEEILSGYWPTALEKARKLRASLGEGRAVDIRHPDLSRDPVGTVEGLYESLGIPWSQTAQASMTEFATRHKAGHSGRHVHQLTGFGLTVEGVRDRFADYCVDLDL
jgi:hypothetical protein